MSNIVLKDLEQSRDLDRKQMTGVRGGNSWLKELKNVGPLAKVNIDVNQNIAQMQNVEVNALNNVGVIGAGFGPLKLDVSPTQWANATVGVR